jgi:hypothetical protein
MPATIKNELAEALGKLNDTVGGGTTARIKTGGKKFAFSDDPDTKLEGPIPVIIIGWISENMYYGGAIYDEKNPVPPVCWALNEEPRLLTPTDKPTDKQADSCSVCPQNEWESGIGKSKACKNMRKLAVIRANSVSEDDPIFALSVSPTGLKEFDGYVRKLGQKNIMPAMVITELSFDEGRAYPSLKFRSVEPNPGINQHWARRAEALAMLLVEPDPSEFKNAAERTNRAPTAPKSGGRSAGSRKV